MRVDFNADLGEGAGHDDELLLLVSSANIATGFHAGDPESIARSMAAARDAHVAVGAHPSFADRENFGRREQTLSPEQLFQLVVDQLDGFRALAAGIGIRTQHVKPHGALYNLAARDAEAADAIARAVAAVDKELVLFALSGSELVRAGHANNLRVASEVFADRNYRADGSLVPRTQRDAVLHDASQVADRVLRMLREGRVRSVEGSDVMVCADTICVHGDTPDAVAFARALRRKLTDEAVEISAHFKA
ncbi:MAG: LamB/YcsF family protein [Verrucomicrobiota bacterium]|nr:LamB/YcsF family protein [Verrucomicrobiota bacterium]